MKKFFYLLLASMFALAFTACSDDDEAEAGNQVKQVYVDASDSQVWKYYSFANAKEVGTGAENEADNAKWAARKDWDIAISRYTVRTNSGAATTVGAKGGLFICDEAVKFSALNTLPENIIFAEDKAVTSEGMQGTTTTVKSEATVIQFKKNADGSLIMPPVYLKSPVYIFRNAHGDAAYKVEFTQYKNEEGKSGHVKFNYAEIK